MACGIVVAAYNSTDTKLYNRAAAQLDEDCASLKLKLLENMRERFKGIEVRGRELKSSSVVTKSSTFLLSDDLCWNVVE